MIRLSFPRLIWFALLVELASLLVVTSATASDSDSVEDMLYASISMYGNLDSIRLEGSIDGGYVREVSRTYKHPLRTSEFSGPAGIETEVRTVAFEYENLFNFLYSKRGDIYLNTVKFHLSRDASGLYKYSTRWEGGVFLASTLGEVMKHDREAGNLLILLMDIVEPERQFKLLEEVPVRGKDTRINGVSHVCVELDTNTRRSLWIDPETKSISKLEYVVSKETRRKEIEFLEHKLSKLGEKELEQRDRILKEIETLENPEQGKKRYVVRIDKQKFNMLPHLAKRDPDGLHDLRTLNVDQEIHQSILQEENARLRHMLAGKLLDKE